MLRHLLITLALIAGLTAHVAEAETTQPQVSVIRVVDGDTVDVRFDDGTIDRLRLIGIDTPEVVDPRKPVQCFGREASAHARELLDGQTVSIEKDPSQGDRDIYGRLLAYIWLPDGRNFGELMIAHGYAHEYTYDLPYAYRDSFMAAQDSAIANQAGLWSPATCAGDTEQPADNFAAAPAPVYSSTTRARPAGGAGGGRSLRPDQVHRPGRPLQLLGVRESGRRTGSLARRSARPEQARRRPRRHRI